MRATRSTSTTSQPACTSGCSALRRAVTGGHSHREGAGDLVGGDRRRVDHLVMLTAEPRRGQVPVHHQPVAGQPAVDATHRAVQVHVVGHPHGTQRAQVEMGVAGLQRVERPAHGRAPVGQAPLPLALLEFHPQPCASVLGVHRHVANRAPGALCSLRPGETARGSPCGQALASE